MSDETYVENLNLEIQ